MEGSAGRKRPGACNLLPAMEGKITFLHWTRYTGGMMLVWQTHLTGDLEAVLLPLTCPTLFNIVSVFSAYKFNDSSAGGSTRSGFGVLYGWYFDFFGPCKGIMATLPHAMPDSKPTLCVGPVGPLAALQHYRLWEIFSL